MPRRSLSAYTGSSKLFTASMTALFRQSIGVVVVSKYTFQPDAVAKPPAFQYGSRRSLCNRGLYRRCPGCLRGCRRHAKGERKQKQKPG